MSIRVVTIWGSIPKDRVERKHLLWLEVRPEPFEKGVSRTWAQTQEAVAG